LNPGQYLVIRGGGNRQGLIAAAFFCEGAMAMGRDDRTQALPVHAALPIG
jgi:hypothetical protein